MEKIPITVVMIILVVAVATIMVIAIMMSKGMISPSGDSLTNLVDNLKL